MKTTGDDHKHSLFTKYRPHSWSDVRGQNHIISIMKGMLKRGTYKYVNGIILGGAAGGGKTTLSRLFAKAINCSAKNKPCNKCDNCRRFNANEYPDYIEEDGAEYNKKEDIAVLKDLANQYASIPDGFRIIYIDEAHALSNAAWDILLKQLEEGETRTIWIFATTEPNKIRTAIQSRCIPFMVKPLGTLEIQDELISICEKEGIEYDNNSISRLAINYRGRTRDAIKILDMYYKSNGNFLNIDISSIEEDMAEVLKLALFNKMEESYKKLENLITVEANEYSRAMSNLLSATFLYPAIIPTGIDQKLIHDFKEMVGKDLKSLIELYVKFKPDNFDDMKLFLLSVTELGIQFKTTFVQSTNQGRRFVDNVDNHLGAKTVKKEVKKKTVINKDQRKKKKFEDMGFVSIKDE